MMEAGAGAAADELPDELYGLLRLKRSHNKSGYVGVYPANSKKRPFQAMIRNQRTGQPQGLGSFKTAQQAAVAVATALSQV